MQFVVATLVTIAVGTVCHDGPLDGHKKCLVQPLLSSVDRGPSIQWVGGVGLKGIGVGKWTPYDPKWGVVL